LGGALAVGRSSSPMRVLLCLGGRGEEGEHDEVALKHDSHLRRPTVSGGGGRRFVGGAGSVEWARCSLRCQRAPHVLGVAARRGRRGGHGSVGAVHNNPVATAELDDPATRNGGEGARSVCHPQKLLGEEGECCEAHQTRQISGELTRRHCSPGWGIVQMRPACGVLARKELPEGK
jgi:hypothetical protein